MRTPHVVDRRDAGERSGLGGRGPGPGRAGLPAAAEGDRRHPRPAAAARGGAQPVARRRRRARARARCRRSPSSPRPMLRLAGLRIDPATNGRHRARTARALTLKAVADGAVRPVTLPPSPALTWLGFSPDGVRFAFAHTQADRHRAVDRRDGDRHAPRRCPGRISTPCSVRRARGWARAPRSSVPPPCPAAARHRRRQPCRPAPTCRSIAAGSRRCAPTRTC